MNWYARLNRWADRFEERLPWLLRFSGVGDPASWYFSHPMFCLGGGVLGAAFAFVQHGDARAGFLVGWAIVAAFYTFVREPLDGWSKYRNAGWAGAIRRLNRNPYGGRYQLGWLVDGVGDVAFCWPYWLLLYWWLAP